MQTVKGVKVRCIKLLKNKVYKFARYISGKHLLLCLSVLMSKRMLCIRLFAPFISLYGNF